MRDEPGTLVDAPVPRAWWGVALAVGALCTLFVSVSRSSWSEPVYVVAALGLSVGFLVVARRRHLQPAGAWLTFGVGLCLLAIGDAVYGLPFDVRVAGLGLDLADVWYLVGSIVMVVGALRLKGAHAGERDREALLDALSVGLATAVLAWRPLIEPRFTVADVPLLGRVVNGSYPVLDVVVVAMVVWILLRSRRGRPAAMLLMAGAVSYLAADIAYTVRIDQGVMDDPSVAWLDVLWLVGYGLYLLGALHPSAGSLGRSAEEEEPSLSRGRLALAGATLLAPIVALGVTGAGGQQVVVALAAEVVLVVLVLVRLSDLATGERRARQALRDRERYFRSLVQHASEAVVVLDRDATVTYASPAVRSLLGVPPDELQGRRIVEAVDGVDREALSAMLATATRAPDVVITGELAVGAGPGARWLELRTSNLLAEPAVAGLVVNLNDVTARRQVQAELERRAFSDPLTGLPNRALFLDRLGQLLGRRDPPEAAVIYCDLDRFKSVNDRFGHAGGDHILEAAAVRLAAAVRAEDTVARLGGDEFAVLVHGPHAATEAVEIARRIVEDLRRPLALGGDPVAVPVSVGVASTRGGHRDPAELIRSADEAMYRAKRAGGDRAVVAGESPAGAAAATRA